MESSWARFDFTVDASFDIAVVTKKWKNGNISGTFETSGNIASGVLSLSGVAASNEVVLLSEVFERIVSNCAEARLKLLAHAFDSNTYNKDILYILEPTRKETQNSYLQLEKNWYRNGLSDKHHRVRNVRISKEWTDRASSQENSPPT